MIDLVWECKRTCSRDHFFFHALCFFMTVFALHDPFTVCLCSFTYSELNSIQSVANLLNTIIPRFLSNQMN